MEKLESESKYYTPSIEEFHVGFEYELKGLDSTTYNCRMYGDNLDTPILESDESIFASIEEEI